MPASISLSPIRFTKLITVFFVINLGLLTALFFPNGLFVISLVLTISLILLLKSRVRWIVIMLFLLLLAPVGAITIGGKTPNIFYEDIYLLFLVLGGIIIWLGKGNKKIIVSNYLPWITLFLSVGLVSLLITPDLLRGLGFFKIYLTGFVALLLCINIIQRKQEVKQIIYFLPCLGSIIALWLTYNLLTAQSLTKANAFISWGHSNYLATFLIFLMPQALGLLFYKKQTWPVKIYLITAVVLMCAGLISTESKGGLISVSLSLLTFFILMIPKLSTVKLIQILLVITLLMGLLAMHPVSNIIKNQFQKFWQDPQLTIQGRTYIYQVALKTFLANPLLGGGLGSFNASMQQFLGPNQAGTTYKAHNEYLHILAEMGLLGLTALLGLLLMSFYNISKLIKISTKDSYLHWWGLGVLAGFLGMLAHIFVESSFFGYQFFIIFWIVMGLGYLSLKIILQQKQPMPAKGITNR